MPFTGVSHFLSGIPAFRTSEFSVHTFPASSYARKEVIFRPDIQADQEDYEEKVSISVACFPDAWRHTLRLRQHNRIHRHG